MGSYRQSSFDPNAYEQPPPPLRPYNWVQWVGVAFGVAGLALYLAYFAGRLGWIAQPFDNSTLGLGPTLIGIILVNSRRQPAHDPAPELAAARKRWLIVTTIICVVVLGAAAVIELQGA